MAKSTAATPATSKSAWTLPSQAQSTYGAYAASPVIATASSTCRTSNPPCRRSASTAARCSGPTKSESATQGPNGVVVADGQVFGATASEVFALDQESGKELWSEPIAESPLAIDMAPGYSRRSRLRLDGAGQRQLRIPGRRRRHPLRARRRNRQGSLEVGHRAEDLWGNKKLNAGGGLWYPPSFDDKGSMYFGTGNPVPYPGTAQRAVRLEPARPEPLHQLAGEDGREDRQARVVLPADARTTSTTGTSRTRRS